MTKSEIALTLAMQYAKIEDEMFASSERRDELKKSDNRDEYELQWVRNEVRQLRSNMETIKASKDALGISDKMWYEAITKTYTTVVTA